VSYEIWPVESEEACAALHKLLYMPEVSWWWDEHRRVMIVDRFNTTIGAGRSCKDEHERTLNELRKHNAALQVISYWWFMERDADEIIGPDEEWKW
jgi:hypothetical protein